MSIECVYLAVIEDDYPVSVADGRNSLGDYDRCGICQLLPECASDLRIGGSIDCAGGVVKNNYLGLFKKRSCDTKSLLLSA